ncbi:TAP-like protein [Pseudonocardia thermophila]|uniref:TAP-like protein n=1 Tax=Pseudonocardia thermophila TaxID=1848 RepID=A0A1M6TYQ9_PSETH|nr:alpha/beta hydrolase [Pseudonocardia thermophila]SHK62030.1 TAP-like protein [Pseudonocardia thermophila]
MRQRPPALRGTLVGLVTLLAAALVAACTVGPSVRPPVAVRGDERIAPGPPAPGPPTGSAPLPSPAPGTSTIDFVDCTDELQLTLRDPLPADRGLRIDCGMIEVPIDPDAPLSITQLQVLRIGTGRPGTKPPLAVVGDSAAEPTARFAAILAGQVPVELLEAYDLVGIDRRGAGYDNLDCAPDTTRAALVDASPTAVDEASLDRLLERARDLVQQCTIDVDSGLASYRSASTGSDLEELRHGLGVRQLSAIGVGDGAAAVLEWARSAPAHVGRVVLDGPPQPGLDDPDLTDSRARATEAAFDAFATACTGGADCPLGPDPRTRVTALMQRLDARPLASPIGDRLTAGTALYALRTALVEPRNWPDLASALAAADAGDPVPLLATLDRALGPRGTFDGTLATACNDTQRRLAPAQAAEFAARMRQAHPLFGGAMALQVVLCAPWPTGRPMGPGIPAGTPPMLVIGTAADPRSTLEGARHLAQQLPGGVFVSWQGAGTGAFPRTACVSDVVTGMLVNGLLPPDGTLCPP